MKMNNSNQYERLFKPIPTTVEEQNALAYELFKWAIETPDAMSIKEFIFQENYHIYSFMDLCKTNMYFAEKVEESKKMIHKRILPMVMRLQRSIKRQERKEAELDF